jgi:hypothetical protein
MAKVIATAILLCMLTNAEGTPTAIGTASARGDMRVDGYVIHGDVTLFDGEVVETEQASAMLHLEKGILISLSTHARATLHRDRLTLQQGSSQWTGASTFPLEVNGVLLRATSPTSRGLVSINSEKNAEVSAITGDLRVNNSRGLLIAAVRPGVPVFLAALQTVAAGSVPTQGPIPMTLYGTLSKVNGHYFLSLPKPDLGVVYELRGGNLEKLVGKEVLIKGSAVLGAAPGVGTSASVITVATVSEILPVGAGILGPVLIGSAIAVGAAAAGTGIFLATESPKPASR